MDPKLNNSMKRQSLSQGKIVAVRCNSLPSFAPVQRKSNYAAFDPNSSKQKISKKSLQESPVPTLQEEKKNLKNIIFNKQDRITELEYFNSFLEDALKKREDITKAYVEENLRLKEELKTKTKVIERLKDELRAIKRSSPSIVDQKQQSFYKGLRTPLERSTNVTNELATSHRYPLETKNLASDRLDSDIMQRFEVDSRSIRIPTEDDPMKISVGPRENVKTMEESDLRSSRRLSVKTERKSDIQARPFKAKTQVVTVTQGRKGPHSLLLDNYNRASILQMTENEIEQVMMDPNLLKLERLLKKESDEIVETLRLSTEQEKNEVFETMRAMDNDIKALINVVRTMKKLLRANSAISVSLVLYDALERIVHETCDILNCDRASVFLLDQINRVLWTKVAKGSSSTIKVPMDSGIVGYAAMTGKAVRIDEAYLDERFNKDIDLKTNYRTRTILTMPIKDMTGGVIGVCQAINKLDGNLFTQDDEEVFQILANQAGVMLKNSIKFDDTLVTHLKLSRLLKGGIEMLQAETLASLLKASEACLKGVFSSEKAVMYMVDRQTKSLYCYDEEGNKVVYSMSIGLVGQAAVKGEILDTKNPDNDPNYNTQVDIDTHLSLLSIPLFSENNEGSLLAVMQVSDLQSSGAKLKLKGEFWEVENLEMFLDIARMCVERLMQRVQYSITKQNSLVSEGGLGQQGGVYYSILKKEEKTKEGQIKTNEPTGTLEPSNELNLAGFQEETGVNDENRKSKQEGKINERESPVKEKEKVDTH